MKKLIALRAVRHMAKSGMNPKTLQYIMGHSDIGVTLNTYTHLGLEDAEDELKGWRTCKAPKKNWNGRKGRGRCHRRCLKQYRRIVCLEALWR